MYVGPKYLHPVVPAPPAFKELSTQQRAMEHLEDRTATNGALEESGGRIYQSRIRCSRGQTECLEPEHRSVL